MASIKFGNGVSISDEVKGQIERIAAEMSDEERVELNGTPGSNALQLIVSGPDINAGGVRTFPAPEDIVKFLERLRDSKITIGLGFLRTPEEKQRLRAAANALPDGITVEAAGSMGTFNVCVKRGGKQIANASFTGVEGAIEYLERLKGSL